MGLTDFQNGLFICICVSALLAYYATRPSRNTPPSFASYRWPILGNAFSLPRKNGHIAYKRLGEQLGGKMFYFEVLGHSILIINDVEVARDLLEKRSAIYSCRPQLKMLTDVIGIKFLFGTMPYGEMWRNHRRVFQQHFSPKNIQGVHSRAVEFARKGLLPNIHQSSEDIYEHIKSFVGGVTLSLTYGLPVRRFNDPLVRESKEVFETANATALPGKYLVNQLPWLQHIPDWMPFTGFKEDGRQIRRQLLNLMERPFDESLKRMESGNIPECFVAESLREHQDGPDFEKQKTCVKEVALQVFSIAFEADVAGLMTLILAMAAHPEAQRKAQQEIDSVVGLHRLPDFSDKESLPYVNAMLKEVLRWNPIIPLGVPHLTTDVDEYEGYHIPKDCVVMANAYAMLHDETIFVDPEKFEPERFIKDGKINRNIPDPDDFATFGFGRRICPGSHIGLSMLYIVAVSILAVYDISPALSDAEGNPIPIVPKFRAMAVTCMPEPFRCKLTPRKDKNVEGLLKDYLGYEFI
ncbi:hypothetical protein AGABI1DRAFT_79771 [Agaricus bisporus var. burnettii JB137-S8]|uniref:Cytochrome P450 n=1 Tax=Agaricus bisporus var. burnettii (strain JB137-S8 / ATCC MYA-4627 / FGSC 10392) TaxID=597362 RepID=K5WYE7_AGABU|nr:uncharacterized protein AGABI1DRAFT_79771 [Agaricus bisporus var. burnettii JB137-S8]EKM75602.1 hypothetical protein AGABI1DRAFT_79771 [Agaricus bisporus var. burnettii JB137-S8]